MRLEIGSKFLSVAFSFPFIFVSGPFKWISGVALFSGSMGVCLKERPPRSSLNQFREENKLVFAKGRGTNKNRKYFRLTNLFFLGSTPMVRLSFRFMSCCYALRPFLHVFPTPFEETLPCCCCCCCFCC